MSRPTRKLNWIDFFLDNLLGRKYKKELRNDLTKGKKSNNIISKKNLVINTTFPYTGINYFAIK